MNWGSASLIWQTIAAVVTVIACLRGAPWFLKVVIDRTKLVVENDMLNRDNGRLSRSLDTAKDIGEFWDNQMGDMKSRLDSMDARIKEQSDQIVSLQRKLTLSFTHIVALVNWASDHQPGEKPPDPPAEIAPDIDQFIGH